jgi:hypothetical protein
MNIARMLCACLALGTMIAVLPMTPALAANDRNAAEFFARVCVNNLGKYRPVESLARSEKWARAPVGQVPSGMPRPSRVKAWLVEIARKPVVVVVGTVKIGGVNIDSCTVVGPATRSSVNAVIKAYRAKQVATYSDANGTAKVYYGQNAGRPVGMSITAVQGGYWLQVTELPRGAR